MRATRHEDGQPLPTFPHELGHLRHHLADARMQTVGNALRGVPQNRVRLGDLCGVPAAKMATRAQLSLSRMAIFVAAMPPWDLVGNAHPTARRPPPFSPPPPDAFLPARAPQPQSPAESIPTSWLGAPRPLASLLPLRINSPGTRNAPPIAHPVRPSPVSRHPVSLLPPSSLPPDP